MATLKKPAFENEFATVYLGDCRQVLQSLPECSVNTVVTSPPYFGLRDYGAAEQIGLEQTPEEYVDELVKIFRQVRRVLRNDGTVWLNLGDRYANDGKWGGSTGGKHVSALHGDSGVGRRRKKTGLKQKDLIGIPWMTALALRADGWYLRQDIIWNKSNPMPESMTDRCTKAHEYIFLLSKSPRYYFNHQAIQEPAHSSTAERAKRAVSPHHKNVAVPAPDRPIHSMHKARANGEGYVYPDKRNKRSVWTVATQPYPDAHFATFPPELIRPCILAGCPAGGAVLDPFAGSGTTLQVAMELQCKSIGIELNPDYCRLIGKRFKQGFFSFSGEL